jgi:hypothetical protein
MPAKNPTKPITAFISPPAIRNAIRKGQPKNSNAPIITHAPNTNLVNGADAPLSFHSFVAIAAIKAPINIPMISGLMY